MRDLIAITITDVSGTRHFTLKKTVQRYLTIAAAAAVVISVASIGFNFIQGYHNISLSSHNNWLTSDNARLNNRLSTQNLQVRSMHNAIGEIEKSAGVETGDNRTALVQRVRTLGQFYDSREGMYEEVGARLAQIEEMLNPQDGGYIWDQKQRDLVERVEIAALSVQQETILRNNIPNGFPTLNHVITSEYGNRVHPISGVKQFHKGVDLRSRQGGKVYATADGIVRKASKDKRNGNFAAVRHNFGFESLYSHLHKLLVKPGDIIHKGDVIGISGNSGHSTGPHLHYEIHYLGRHVDPTNFLKWEFGSNEIFTQVRRVKWQSLINLINKQIANPALQLSQLDVESPEK